MIQNSYLLIKIGSKRIKILILNSGRLQISRHISFVDSNRLYKWRISLVTIKSQETTIRIKMQSKLIIPTRNYKNVKKQQDYCSVGYAIRQHKVSGSVIRNSYLLIKIGSERIKILILNSGRLQISRHISLVDSYQLHIECHVSRHISFVGSNRLYKWRISLIIIRKSKEFTAWNEKKQQDYCSVGYAIRQH